MKAMVFCWCWLLATLVLAAPSEQKRSPDLVIFLTDDQGQLDLAPYGSRDMITPNMQRLADAGMTFTDAYVASPTCAPSRAALLTGLMPARNGAEPNHAKPRPEIRKWPSYFQELGYEVVAFGKISHYKHTVDYGFDYFAHDGFHEDVSIDAAVKYLSERGRGQKKPLCLFVGSNWPHVPWPELGTNNPADASLPARSIDTPKTKAWRARYVAAVARADEDLGRIMEAARSSLGTNSLFLFSSDNGAQWPFAKWNCYEAGVRTPLIIAWPGVVQPGTRTAAMVSWVDYLPTLLEVAGGKAPQGIDGRSFGHVLRDPAAKHRDCIFTTHSGDGRFNIYPIRAVREGKWKYIRNLHPEFAFTTHIDLPVNLGQRDYFQTWEAAGKTNAEARAILKSYHARPAEELYDLAADPQETKNLALDPQYASQIGTLRRKLDAWMREQGDAEKVYAEPRLLSDPSSYGPQATNPAQKQKRK